MTEERKTVLRAQWLWPVGMPLCRPMETGFWEIWTDLPSKRTARVLLCLYREHLVALHGFIKKARATIRLMAGPYRMYLYSHEPKRTDPNSHRPRRPVRKVLAGSCCAR